jgi:hypothetical protein
MHSDLLNPPLDSEDGPGKPEECNINGNINWQSIQIQQPSSGDFKYSVDLFSGEGCNNPIAVSFPHSCECNNMADPRFRPTPKMAATPNQKDSR